MLREEIRKNIIKTAQAHWPGTKIPEFSVSVPENLEHGDYATNIAMLLGRFLKENPLEIASALAQELNRENAKFSAEAAPPGFINFLVSEKYITEKLDETRYEVSVTSKWQGKRIIVEFTDPNPFKEFHIGHLYTNIVGETISRLLEASGAVVGRANYQGDVGLHVAKAIWGMQRRIHDTRITIHDLEEKSLEKRIQFMGESYAESNRAYEEDEKAKEEIASLNKKIFALDPEVADIYSKGRGWSLEYFENIYKRLGAKFDFYYFEREVGETGLQLVKEYLDRGVFEKSDGAIVFPGEKYGLHRRVFINSEGLPTYEAKELGLAPKKQKDFPHDLSIIVTGNEIIEYFKVLVAALIQIYPDLGKKTLHIAHGMVRLPAGKMSSRTGEVVRAENLLNSVKEKVLIRMEASDDFSAEEKEEVSEKIALGAVKYSLLRVGVGKDIVFDVDTSLNMEGDSGPYLQYTYARFRSILRKAGEGSEKLPSLLSLTEVEKRLSLALLRFGEALEDSANSFSPSTLATYLHNTAMLANEFYHTHPVTQESDEEKKQFRLKLIQLLTKTLQVGLGILGIDAPEKM